MSTVTEQRFTPITGENAPAVFNLGWLPDLDAFPELTETREEYLRLHAAWQAAGARRRDLENRIEQAEDRRKAALSDAYLSGDIEPHVEAEDDKLKAELVVASEHAQAAAAAYLESINKAIAVVIEHHEQWLGAIGEFQAGVDAEIEGLLRQAKALRSRRGNFARLEHWVYRTAVKAADMPAYHFPYADIALPPSGDPGEEETLSLERMLRSYAGGLAPDKPATEQEGRRAEQQVLASQQQEPIAQNDEVHLDDLDEDDLVDWLMGTGRFDGQAKPTAQYVIEVAEGDVSKAERLLKAERIAGGDAVRQEVIDRLTEIANTGKDEA